MKLTALRIAKHLETPGRYYDEDGLALQVNAPGFGSWVFKYERDGRQRMYGLGSTRNVSLKLAREKAKKARELLGEEKDPIAERREQRARDRLEQSKRKTFRECAEAYYKANSDQWKNEKHRRAFLSTLKMDAFPKIGHLPVRDIDVGHVLSVLEPIWREKPETASRIRARIEIVLSWATVRNYRIGDNPARWRGFLSTQLTGRGKIAPVKHLAALPYPQLPEFMIELRKRPALAARTLEFLILTATRTGAVTGATWDEIDFKARLWTVPPDRAGAKIGGDQPRRVPLCDRAIELLKALPREEGNPHVFIGAAGKGLSNMAMLTLLKRMKRNDVTVHGFRSCFKDWCSEQTNYPNIVSEAALWHVVADPVEGAYRRGDVLDKRRRLMAEWSRYCASVPVRSGKVVPLRSRVAS